MRQSIRRRHRCVHGPLPIIIAARATLNNQDRPLMGKQECTGRQHGTDVLPLTVWRSSGSTCTDCQLNNFAEKRLRVQRGFLCQSLRRRHFHQLNSPFREYHQLHGSTKIMSTEFKRRAVSKLPATRGQTRWQGIKIEGDVSHDLFGQRTDVNADPEENN